MTFAALWQLVDDAPLFDKLVKTGNRIRFNLDTNRDVMKDKVADADLPELMLLTSGISAVNMHSSSCTTMITRRFSWVINTGDMRVQYRLYPVEFAIMCAMANWKSLLGGLNWNGELFVKKCDLVSAENAQVETVRGGRSLLGWSALWTGEVTMVFGTRTLVDYLQNTGSSSGD
jgi:hypothetical protein